MHPKVLILFRNDDLCAWSNPLHEDRLLRLFNDYGVPVTLGVIPKVRGWRVDENRPILELLEKAKASGHELALHGLEHDHREFERLPLDELRRRLDEGQRLMRKWFGEPTTTFIPPDNAWMTDLLSTLPDFGFSTLSSGLPLKPLLPSKLVVVDAVAHFLFAPLIALIKYLTSLPLPVPLPLVVYFHSWEMQRKPHWGRIELLLRVVKETPGLVAMTFSEAERRHAEALRFWAAWRQDKFLVDRWNAAFHSRAFYRARMWHRYWRDLRERGFPTPALERWMVQAYTAALMGDVVELERIIAKPFDGWIGTNTSEMIATLTGWVPLAVLGCIRRFVHPSPPSKMEDAFRILSSSWLATIAFGPDTPPQQHMPVSHRTAPSKSNLSRSLVYLSFDRHLVSAHAVMTSKALMKRGWWVTLIHPQGALWGANSDGLRRVQVGVKETKSVWDWFAQWEMAQLITRWQPPVIYARQHWIGMLPPFIARRYGIPYVAEFNGLRHRSILARQPRSLKGRFIRWLERWCANWATAIVVPSKPLAERIARLVGSDIPIHDLTHPSQPFSRLPFPAIFVVPNGIDSDIFRPLSQEETRQQLGLPLDRLYIAYTGSLHIWQGVDVLLRAFAHLIKQFPRCRLLVVGGHDEPNKDAYRKLAQALNIADHVHFVPFVPYEQSALYIAAADVCVAPYVPSYCEHGGGSPLKLYAYLSCGRPVVLSDLGEFVDADLVRVSGAGLLVPPGDPEALAEAVGKLLSDPALRSEMGRRGREAILGGYTWDHNAQRIEAILLEAMGARRW